MKFLNYLNEYKDKDVVHTSRFQSKSEEEFKELLHQPQYLKSLQAMIKNDVFIYRGNRNLSGDYFHFSQGKGNRPSQNTANYYTLMINNSPKWKAYPKRDYICTTHLETARSYGYKMTRDDSFFTFMIPKWGSKIGVCGEKDIFFSFSNFVKHFNNGLNYYDADEMNTMITQTFNQVEKGVHKTFDWNKFKKLCDKMDEEFHFLHPTGFVKIWEKSGKKFYDFLEDMMSPEKNEFSVTKMDSNINIEKENEVWMDCEGLAFDVKLFDKVKEMI